MSKRKKEQWQSAQLNQMTYIDYYQRLKELALNCYEWVNVPDTIDPRFLELALYEMGYALWFEDEVLGNLALTCTIGGQLDVYRIPLFRRAYATNGYSKPCSNKDSVLIYNNYLRTPTDLTIRMFAQRLYECERTIDVNIKAQKTPILVLSSEQQRLTMKNLYMQYDGNEPFIFGDKNMEFDGLQALKTDAPFIADKMQIVKNRIWNEALTFLGIENSNQDKKERMVADEVGSNYGNIEAQRNTMLKARQQACDKINKMFNLNISVKFNSNLVTMVNMDNVSRETLIEGVEEIE